jgi:hypothetical protein
MSQTGNLKARINTPVRTVIADPKFRALPNVALVELTDVIVGAGVADGDVLAYDTATGKFIFATSSINIDILNGGSF